MRPPPLQVRRVAGDRDASQLGLAGKSGDTASGYIIRSAISADLPSLGKLGVRLVEEHHSFDGKRFLAPWNQMAVDYASFLGAQLKDPDSVIFVADNRGAVIGYTFGAIQGPDYIALRGPAGVLHDLIVDPGHRGRGVGRLLLDTILAYLNSRGAPRVVLSTAEQNESAQRLFEHTGFRRTMVEMTREMDGSEMSNPPSER